MVNVKKKNKRKDFFLRRFVNLNDKIESINGQNLFTKAQ